jgi:hypothetical protein
LTITYNIQKVDFFVDQIEEKVQVDLDGAIDAFQNFPFEDQLKQAAQRELTSCLPTISFKNSDGKTLGIWAQDDKGFFLFYDTGKQTSEFFLSNDFNKNPEGLTVEEFIELFFNGTIEQSIKLNDKFVENNDSNDKKTELGSIVTFSFSDTNKFTPLVWTILYFILALAIFRVDMVNKFEIGWGIHLLMGFFWIPGMILHISYWIKNNSARVTIFPKEKIIEYEKNGQVIKFSRNEINNCEVNEGRRIWSGYSYLWIVLKDERKIIITSFIAKPELIVDMLNLNFKTRNRVIPFLTI